MQLPDDGPDAAREPLRRRRHAHPLRPRARPRRGPERRRGRDRRAAPRAAPDLQTAPDGKGGPTRRSPGRFEYERGVEQAKRHIRAGDAFQIVLSQRARAADAGVRDRPLPLAPARQPVAVPLPARARRPGARRLLARDARQGRERDRASLNPIAGTTHPGEGDAERLLASEKDRAEHVMLVDLGRNDLSRVCKPGTVRVERFLEPERYSHVTHLVSEVTGELNGDVSHFDLLRACFPAGTVSGAPKVRAMQIISELEGYRRGPYAGAVGYFAAGRPARHLHRDPDDRAPRRGRVPPGRRRDRRRLFAQRRARRVPAEARRARARDRARGGPR